ncbi:hypothetical protein MHU86_25268 [Fragilaria crotonensis]|nr:hypothetical protein MHU86_25268 [Fragilaria crotonensis]
MEPEQVGDIDFNAMFPGVENHAIRYVFHVCGLTEIAAQTRLIDFEGIDEVEDLANYTDREIDQMADRNAKRNPANQRVQFGLKRTKYLKAVCHWVRKNVREGAPCDVRELTPALIAELIQDMIARASQKDSDSKLYYPEAFSATDYKNWIKKVENYLDSRIGKSGVPLSYVIRPANVDPAEAPDEYTRAMWATSFETQQFREDNREVYHLFKDLVTKTEGATWFEKVKDGDGRAAHLLLREHYYLTRLNEAFKELEDAGQALWEAQKVTHLLKGIQNDDIQVQTTIGIVRNSFLSDFDGACLTLSRTISSRFASVEANRQKRRIGAVESRAGNRSGRGCVRGRGGRGGRGGGRDGGRMRVIMNGVDVTDISRNFTSDEWEKNFGLVAVILTSRNDVNTSVDGMEAETTIVVVGVVAVELAGHKVETTRTNPPMPLQPALETYRLRTRRR